MYIIYSLFSGYAIYIYIYIGLRSFLEAFSDLDSQNSLSLGEVSDQGRNPYNISSLLPERQSLGDSSAQPSALGVASSQPGPMNGVGMDSELESFEKGLLELQDFLRVTQLKSRSRAPHEKDSEGGAVPSGVPSGRQGHDRQGQRSRELSPEPPFPGVKAASREHVHHNREVEEYLSAEDAFDSDCL